MNRRTFAVNDFIVSEGYDANGNVLMSLEGWDTYDSLVIETAPRLVGAGSYIVSQPKPGERTIVAQFFVTTNARTGMLDDFQNLLGSWCTLKRRYYQGAVLEKTETMTALCRAVQAFDTWETNGNAMIQVSFLAVNPYKEVLTGEIETERL